MVQPRIKEISMQGFNIAEAGHVPSCRLRVFLGVGPDQSGVLDEALQTRATILIAPGAEATQDAAAITLSLCSSAAGANATAIPFNYYFQALGGAGNDVLKRHSERDLGRHHTGGRQLVGKWPDRD
jgi:hypothetical protein